MNENKLLYFKIISILLHRFVQFATVQMYMFGLLECFIYKHYVYFGIGVAGVVILPISYLMRLFVKDVEDGKLDKE